MKKIFLLLFLPFLGCTNSTDKDNESKTSDTSEWVSLFNGENLDGWQLKINGQELNENYLNTFRVEDGILKIRYDGYESFDEQFGALYTNKSYENYRLKVEYRFVGETAPGAPLWGNRDSGVQYHCQDPATMALDQQFPICVEYNLHGGNGVDERPVGQICSNGVLVDYQGETVKGCNDAINKITIHGDEWAILEIDVQGKNIKHFINGEEILSYQNPHYDPENAVAATMIKDGDSSLRSGFISLQSNSHPIDFRKIEIKEY